MTMRLNLDAVLRNQVRAQQERKEEREQVNMGNKLRMKIDDGSRYFPEKTDVKQRVNSMMVNLHKQMKVISPPRKAVPAVPAAIAQLPPPPSVIKSSSSRKLRRVCGGGVAVMPVSKGNVMPISQVKARMSRQTQQIMRRGYAETGPKTFTNQRRIREVLLQKTVLENMLLQHKRLQRDRQTIALDIQRMRQDLDRIKTKLETSLQTLNSTRTIFANASTKSKKSLVSASLPTNVVNSGPKMSGSVAAKPKPSAAKRGNIIPKRQRLSTVKRRIRA